MIDSSNSYTCFFLLVGKPKYTFACDLGDFFFFDMDNIRINLLVPAITGGRRQDFHPETHLSNIYIYIYNKR